MSSSAGTLQGQTAWSSVLAARYAAVRDQSTALLGELEPEDTVVQTMPEVSPTKWHVAHVTWFFEQFCLVPHAPGYSVFHERYAFLFNSYYLTVGRMHQRPARGLLSRPSLSEILAYREHVDQAMTKLIRAREGDPDFASLVTLGLNHEQQHQELLLTDIKHVFFTNPLGPAYRAAASPDRVESVEHAFLSCAGGEREIGAGSEGFCFDNETPRHRVLIEPYAIGNRLVTNAEYRAFIDDGAYDEPSLWLSDGWARQQAEGWDRPLYWSADFDREFTLSGWRGLDPDAPVCHVSFYEADAYARWAGVRLPTEQEWEVVAEPTTVAGNLLESGYLHPVPARAGDRQSGVATVPSGIWGDVWEWTASPYVPYPRFKPLAGSLGEYNGKFMANQMVVRGGSCVSSADHLRSSYRSFFYPHDRWQFLGIRLARDD